MKTRYTRALRILLSGSTLILAGSCGPVNGDVEIGTIEQALVPSISSFTVSQVDPTGDPYALKFTYQISSNGTPGNAYIYEDTGNAVPVAYNQGGVLASGDYDVGIIPWCANGSTCTYGQPEPGFTPHRAIRGGVHRYMLAARYTNDPAVDTMYAVDITLPDLPEPGVIAVTAEEGANSEPNDPHRNRVYIYDADASTPTTRTLQFQAPTGTTCTYDRCYVRVLKPGQIFPTADSDFYVGGTLNTCSGCPGSACSGCSTSYSKTIDLVPPIQSGADSLPNFGESASAISTYRLHYCVEKAVSGTSYWRETCSRPVSVSYDKRALFFDNSYKRLRKVIVTGSATNQQTLAWKGAAPKFWFRGSGFQVYHNGVWHPNGVCLASAGIQNSVTFQMPTAPSPGTREIRISACCDPSIDNGDPGTAGCTSDATNPCGTKCEARFERREFTYLPAATPTIQEIPWDDEFTAEVFPVHPRPAGFPLDIVFDTTANGTQNPPDVWAIGEFAPALARVKRSTSSVEHYQVPLRRDTKVAPLVDYSVSGGPSSTFFQRVGPYNGKTKSPLAERIIHSGNTGNLAPKYNNIIWFVQGGTEDPLEKDRNFARVIGFKRDMSDVDSTAFDDRMCAIHIPDPGNRSGGYDPTIVGHEWGAAVQAYGVVWDGANSKVRVTTYGNDPVPTEIVSFDPIDFMVSGGNSWYHGPGGCDNWVYYNDDLVNGGDEYESAKEANTENINRFTRVGIMDAGVIGNPHLQHLVMSGSKIWYTAKGGGRGQIGFYDTTTAVEDAWLIPPSYRVNGAPYPWQLRQAGDWVYYGEFSDVQVMRFNITGEQFGPAFPPIWGREVALHSIAYENSTPSQPRLWFTLKNQNDGVEEVAASAFGYINLANWPAGKIYNISNPQWSTPPKGQQHSLRGIDVWPDPTRPGKVQVALADGGTDEIVVLTEL